MQKKVIFITTTNLYNNPRLVKELHLFSGLSYSVTAIVFNVGYGDDKSIDIESKLPNVNFIKISALRDPLFSWLFSTIAEKAAISITSLLKNSLLANAIAHNKRTFLINRKLKVNNQKFDLIISDTLGALYPAYQLSKKTNTPFAFDMEDYHPGEQNYSKNPLVEIRRREFLLESMLPKATFTTYAAPLFLTETNKLFKTPLKKQYVINNGFLSEEFELCHNSSSKINLVWYSLNIAQGRGLELILPIIKKFSDKIHLTLIGKLNPDFDKNFQISEFSNITLLGHLSQKRLHQELCKADVGLSLEQSSTDLNRDLCLTNKIISYCQAGLYILATPTQAQKDLIHNNPSLGVVSGNLEQNVVKIIETIDGIRKNKEARFNHGEKFSWDAEQEKYKMILKNV
jgi:hypothetical protein